MLIRAYATSSITGPPAPALLRLAFLSASTTIALALLAQTPVTYRCPLLLGGSRYGMPLKHDPRSLSAVVCAFFLTDPADTPPCACSRLLFFSNMMLLDVKRCLVEFDVAVLSHVGARFLCCEQMTSLYVEGLGQKNYSHCTHARCEQRHSLRAKRSF